VHPALPLIDRIQMQAASSPSRVSQHVRSLPGTTSSPCVPSSVPCMRSTRGYARREADAARQGDAYIYIAGAGGALVTTLCFLRVLFVFPRFLAGIKAGGVDAAAYGRLRTFHRLNVRPVPSASRPFATSRGILNCQS
jgi:hypothetical protein